jgi:nucleoid DNA-binding protein
MPAKKVAAKQSAAKKKTTAVKKSTARKIVAKKEPAAKAAKKTSVKKTVAAAKPKPIKKISEKLTKSQLLMLLSEQTGLSKKEVTSVLETLESIIAASVSKGALGEFTLPGLVKILTVRKPAAKARKGINPFTGEETMFKAKPARTVIKVRPLKKLKDMA